MAALDAGTPPAELEAIAVQVARACGELITSQRPRDLGVAATKSSAVDIVTEMDRRSEQLAGRLLQELRPGDAQFGEEGLRRPGATGITWVVDPIDGTVNYLYDIPAYAVSVAAVTGDPSADGAWHPIAGAVYNPSTDEMFSAALGAGARLSVRGAETALLCDPAAELSQSLVATGFSYRAEIRAEQAAALVRLLPRVRDIRRLGSAALDLCHVAAGRVDAYYERLLNPWDMAAGWLVAREAGAEVRGLRGAAPGSAFTMAGSAATLDALEALVA